MLHGTDELIEYLHRHRDWPSVGEFVECSAVVSGTTCESRNTHHDEYTILVKNKGQMQTMWFMNLRRKSFFIGTNRLLHGSPENPSKRLPTA